MQGPPLPLFQQLSKYTQIYRKKLKKHPLYMYKQFLNSKFIHYIILYYNITVTVDLTPKNLTKLHTHTHMYKKDIYFSIWKLNFHLN